MSHEIFETNDNFFLKLNLNLTRHSRFYLSGLVKNSVACSRGERTFNSKKQNLFYQYRKWNQGRNRERSQ